MMQTTCNPLSSDICNRCMSAYKPTEEGTDYITQYIPYPCNFWQALVKRREYAHRCTDMNGVKRFADRKLFTFPTCDFN